MVIYFDSCTQYIQYGRSITGWSINIWERYLVPRRFFEKLEWIRILNSIGDQLMSNTFTTDQLNMSVSWLSWLGKSGKMELKKPNLFFIRSDKLTVFYGGSRIILGHVWSPKPQFVGRDCSVRPQRLDRLFCALDPQFTLTFQSKSSQERSAWK